MISPAFLDELDRFDAAGDRRVRSRRRGEEPSTARGEGVTFSDYRRYTPGDEPARVDWKLYGRTEELYVKQFEEERQATVHVLLDASGSMEFGEEVSKFEFGAKLGLGFAYLAGREGNRFRVSAFGGGLDRLDGDRSDRGEVLRLIDRCNDLAPTGEAAFEEVLSSYAGTIRSKAVVVVVSDFLADPADVDAGIAALADNELLLAHVLAAGEREPPASGDTIFEALESEASVRTYFGRRPADAYRRRLREHLAEVAALGERLGARHERLETDEPFFDAFARLWY